MKNTLDGINSRLDIAENKISKYEGIAIVKQRQDTQK